MILIGQNEDWSNILAINPSKSEGNSFLSIWLGPKTGNIYFCFITGSALKCFCLEFCVFLLEQLLVNLACQL